MFVESSWQLWSQSRADVFHFTRRRQQSRVLQHLCWMVTFLKWQLRLEIIWHPSTSSIWQRLTIRQLWATTAALEWCPQSIKWLSTITRERQIPPDSESGGIPHLSGTFLSPHIGSAWRARHDNNNNNKSYLLFQMFRNAYDIILMWEQLDYELNGWSEKLSAFIWPCFQSKKSETWS